MKCQKTIKIPIHYLTTKAKMDKLNRTTARITYCIRLINKLVDEDTKLDRSTIRELVRDNDIFARTGLLYRFVDQCIDKVIWSWKSYKRLHGRWKNKIEYAKKKDNEKYLKKLLKREPSPPKFGNKICCRIDYRTGKIQWNKSSKITELWIHLSTLKKRETMDVPLNPSHYHINQLRDAKINDFEIIKNKKDKKYYAHITITKEVEDKPMSSIGGIDQGLNHSVAIVLLPDSGKFMPYEGLICDREKQEHLQKYEEIVGELQNAGKWRKLRELRNKRKNVSINYDWEIANKVAEISKGYLIAIGDTSFGKTQYRGNGMPKLRKRIGKWSYSRQREMIKQKRTENGYPTVETNEYGTSRECYQCHSMFTRRKWLPSGESYILCHNCGLKKDADINASYNIAYTLRCLDERLKVGMNWVENPASLQDGCPSFDDGRVHNVL